ncbi:MAG TPA: glycosyl hydrolase family 28-related protein, partial [Woeseiaceae bacterium]|nr:glycosyl hydrolase family 28-related protein [Woeseiaceae bacterium]
TRPAGQVSITEFGAVGDGETDDSQAIQAAVEWAARHPGTALHVPARIFGLRHPVRVPGAIELAGEVPGSGNHPLCGFRALPGFRCELVQRYRAAGTMQRLDVAALLMCEEWTRNAEFARRLHLRDLFFDVDSKTDTRGAPIHGLLLANQQLDLHNVWIRHPTGHGVWINTQRPDGEFVQPIVDNVLRRVWVRGAGIGGAIYSTDQGTRRYGAFLIGALPGARDPAGGTEPALATDGILDYCTVSVGPENGLGCRGDGIYITQAAGWRVTACHVNGAGRHGIGLYKAYQTEVSGCYVDGWGVDAEANEGDFGGIWCASAVSLGHEADGGILIGSNRIRARGVRATDGNRFAAIGLSAGITSTPRGIVAGNVISRRRDAAHGFSAFHFAHAGKGELETIVIGNSVSGARRLFMSGWDGSAIRARFTGNNFQYADAPPGSGWHPAGLRIENATPRPGGWSGWLNIEAGKPGTWKGAGMIEA